MKTIHLYRHRQLFFQRMFALATAGLFLFGSIVNAQQSVVPGGSALEEEEVEVIPEYIVELIVFEYADRASAGTEVFLPDPAEFPESDEGFNLRGTDDFDRNMPLDEFGRSRNMDGDLERMNSFPAEAETPIPEAPLEDIELAEIQTVEQFGLQILPATEYSLDEVYAKLLRLDAYRPILRTAWKQPTLEKEATQTINLRRLGNPPLRLSGSVSLYLSRFLHLVIDLSLEEKSPVQPPTLDNRPRRFGDDRTSYRFDSEFMTPTIYYRIEEDRIVRNGELRYFDHPRFGVIAKIIKAEEANSGELGTESFN